MVDGRRALLAREVVPARLASLRVAAHNDQPTIDPRLLFQSPIETELLTQNDAPSTGHTGINQSSHTQQHRSVQLATPDALSPVDDADLDLDLFQLIQQGIPMPAIAQHNETFVDHEEPEIHTGPLIQHPLPVQMPPQDATAPIHHGAIDQSLLIQQSPPVHLETMNAAAQTAQSDIDQGLLIQQPFQEQLAAPNDEAPTGEVSGNPRVAGAQPVSMSLDDLLKIKSHVYTPIFRDYNGLKQCSEEYFALNNKDVAYDQSIPNDWAAQTAVVGKIFLAIVDMSQAQDKPNSKARKEVLDASNVELQLISWDIFFCLKNAQNGEVGIPPWAEASKYEPYATFNDRLEKALEVLRKRKAVVKDLMRANYTRRFAAAPNKQNKSKEANEILNDKRKSDKEASKLANQKMQTLEPTQSLAASPFATPFPATTHPMASFPAAPGHGHLAASSQEYPAAPPHGFSKGPSHGYATRPSHGYATGPSHGYSKGPSHGYSSGPSHGYVAAPSHAAQSLPTQSPAAFPAAGPNKRRAKAAWGEEEGPLNKRQHIAGPSYYGDVSAILDLDA